MITLNHYFTDSYDQGRRRSSLKDVVDFMQDKMTVYDAVYKACKEIEMVGEDGKW